MLFFLSHTPFTFQVNTLSLHDALPISAGLEPGDAVILCSAKPSWVKANEEEPEAYATLDFFEREIIRPQGAQVRLSLRSEEHTSELQSPCNIVCRLLLVKKNKIN